MLLRFALSIILLTATLSCTHPAAGSRVLKVTFIPNDPCSDSSYNNLLLRIGGAKANFKTAYLRSSNKSLLLDSCRAYLESCLADSLFPFWEHTPWAFYGTSEKPKCGEIACGYFVTTMLRDIGFQIPRVRWAEVASETFIREFCGNKVYHQIAKPTGDVMEFLKKQKANYLLVGLDTHVGIIEKRDTAIQFIHSANFVLANGVTREPADGFNPFASSTYKVFGELFTDIQLTNWIWSRPYP